LPGTPRTDPYERSLAHTAPISDDWRQNAAQAMDEECAAWETSAYQAIHPGPGVAVSLTATDQTRPPQPCQPDPKGPQGVAVSRYRMVVEVALHDRLEPLARLRHRLVHAGAKLPFDFQPLVDGVSGRNAPRAQPSDLTHVCIFDDRQQTALGSPS